MNINIKKFLTKLLTESLIAHLKIYIRNETVLKSASPSNIAITRSTSKISVLSARIRADLTGSTPKTSL